MPSTATTCVAINGFGRVGRAIAAHLTSRVNPGIKLLAVNDPNVKNVPSSHFGADGGLIFHFSDDNKIKWADFGIDTVIESTKGEGLKERVSHHLENGAQRVIITQPAEIANIMVIYGVNHHMANLQQRVISASSCTANGTIPAVNLINSLSAIKSLRLAVQHTYDPDNPFLELRPQWLSERQNQQAGMRDLRDSIDYPTTLGQSIAQFFPDLILGDNLRVSARRIASIYRGFAIFLDFYLESAITKEAFLLALKQAQESFAGMFMMPENGISYSDIQENPHSVIIPMDSIQSDGRQFNMLVYQDNIYGYAARVVDLINYLHALK